MIEPIGQADVDVAIIGGGPAGTAAAITLARAGIEATIVDKAEFPRDKTCGDGLTAWALRQLESLGWNPADASSFRGVDAAWVGSPSRRMVRFPLSAPGLFAGVVRRTELDSGLVNLARRAGAKLLDGVACTGATTCDGGIRLELANQSTLSARYVIAADGMWSPLRKFLGGAIRSHLGDWYAMRQYMTGVGPLASQRLYAWFEPDFLPGYAWSFPLGDGASNVGFGILRASRWHVGSMGTLWPEILARPHIAAVLGPDAVAEGPVRAWPIPCALDQVPPTIGRAMFVGDAVAAADPMTGEGIGQALATGTWAAEAILAAPRAQPDAATDHYRDRLATELGPDQRMSWLLNRALAHRKGARSAIRIASMTDWTRRNFARWLFEDYPRGIAFTPSRWRRGLMSGPGAYADSS